MGLKNIVIFIFLYTGLACCRSTGSRQLPFNDTTVTAQLRQYNEAKQYDSLYHLGHRWIISKIKEKQCDTALAMARKVCTMLDSALPLQKKLMLEIYDKRDIIETDTLALKKFYRLFAHKYPDHFDKSYDADYINLAGYFTLLPARFSFLPQDDLLYFHQTLGIAYNMAGDIKRSLYHNGIVYAADLADTSGLFLPYSTINTSIALNETRQYDSVTRMVNFALRKKNISNNNRSGLYIVMADAMLNAGDIDSARQYLLLADRSTEKITVPGEQHKRLFEAAQLKSRLLVAQHKFSEAAKQQRLTLAYGLVYEEKYHTRDIGKTLLQLGSCFKKLNLPDSAVWYFHQALYTVAQVDSANILSLPEEKSIYAENTMMDALDSLAMMWDEQYLQTNNTGFLKKAVQARKLAFMVETKLLEAYSYDESMKSQLLHSKKRSEYALNNCWQLWKTNNDAQWIAEAMLMNEYSKAVALLHSLKKNTALSTVQQDSQVVQLNKIRLQVISLEKELNATTGLPEKTAIQQKLNKLNDEAVLLDNTLKQRLPGYKRSGIDTTLLSPGYIEQKLLTRKSCLLQYFRADSGAYIVWLDHTGASGMQWVHGNDLKKVDDFITECRNPKGLYENDQPAFFSLAKACTGIALPDAVQQKIKNGSYKKLLVIPDGPFSILPFDALTPGGNEFLVQYSTVYTGYSISTLLANEPEKPASNIVSVFAPFTQTGNGTLQRLQFSQNEADAIAAAKKQVTVYADTNATLSNFRQTLGTSGIVHTATHAIGNDSLQQIFFRNGVLDVAELYATHTNAELVVLSGCETGIGRLDPNEGPLSLARGFYYAGARNVINSLWQIDDLATAVIFSDFYKTYSPGSGRAGKALHKAKLDYLKNNSGRLLAPYYWAGLVHTGVDEEHAGNKRYGWLLPSLMITVVLLIVLRIRHIRRRR